MFDLLCEFCLSCVILSVKQLLSLLNWYIIPKYAKKMFISVSENVVKKLTILTNKSLLFLRIFWP